MDGPLPTCIPETKKPDKKLENNFNGRIAHLNFGKFSHDAPSLAIRASSRERGKLNPIQIEIAADNDRFDGVDQPRAD
jgi:hypothetical protein